MQSDSKKVRYRFPKIFDDEDFIAVLTESPQTNSTVREKVVARHPIKYKTLSAEWTKQTLIRLEAAGMISGGKDPEVGIYLWTVKKEDTNKLAEKE